MVVILPDSGSRYISKFHSDEWMKDNGFWDADDRLGRVRDLVARRPQELLIAFADETAGVVALRMKQHGISQLPVVDRASRAAVGMVHESDLLDALLSSRLRHASEIAPAIAPLAGRVTMDTPVSKLKEVFAQDQVAVVLEGDRPLAVVTKIDLIDYLGSR